MSDNEEKLRKENDKFVEEFIEKVQHLELEIRELVDWTNQFHVSPKREDARQMVKICNVSFFLSKKNFELQFSVF